MLLSDFICELCKQGIEVNQLMYIIFILQMFILFVIFGSSLVFVFNEADKSLRNKREKNEDNSK